MLANSSMKYDLFAKEINDKINKLIFRYVPEKGCKNVSPYFSMVHSPSFIWYRCLLLQVLSGTWLWCLSSVKIVRQIAAGSAMLRVTATVNNVKKDTACGSMK